VVFLWGFCGAAVVVVLRRSASLGRSLRAAGCWGSPEAFFFVAAVRSKKKEKRRRRRQQKKKS